MAVFQPSSPNNFGNRRTIFGVCLLLAALVFLVFGRTLSCGFVFDDDVYVVKNPIVQEGLSWKGFCWALSYGQIGHWHPLTWISHMIDCDCYGLNASGHHFTNVLLHAATTILLFFALQQMTGAIWRSAFVAMIFAVHPLRVESVAWISERKDVLSAFFFMLTLTAYLQYVRRPSITRYSLMVLAFGLGLLSKNMLVTLPFILLLLDYWPLNRISSFSFSILHPLIIEKIPLLMLAAGSCVMTFLAPEKVSTFVRLPFELRLENAVISYAIYISQMIYPVDLACLYPNPAAYFPLWKLIGALTLLLTVSVAVWIFRKEYPWLSVGWLWYLGMLVPTIGIVQISFYAHADRYTYLPQIGLYFAIVWAVSELTKSWNYRRQILIPISVILVTVLSVCTWKQIAYWRTEQALWKHAVACTSGNYIAENNLAFDIAWNSPTSSPDQIIKAMEHCKKAIEINPKFPEAHFNMGMLFAAQGKTDEAIEQYKTGLAVEPDNPKVHHKLADIYFSRRQWDDAIEHYQQTLRQMPDLIHDRYQLAVALECRHRFIEAITQFQEVIELNPTHVAAKNDLAWILATCSDATLRDGPKAVELALQAAQFSANTSPQVLDTLAAAYAETGQFSQAIETTKLALNLAVAQKNQPLTDNLRKRLQLYQSGLPYHE